jgi:serine phosphatase RsbU (regulator of sigma subunit)
MKTASRVELKGLVLGLGKDERFNELIEEKTIRLEPGDKLLFYTDGVVEAKNSFGDDFGVTRLLEIVTKNSNVPVKGIIDDIINTLETFCGAEAQQDDITIFALEYKPKS